MRYLILSPIRSLGFLVTIEFWQNVVCSFCRGFIDFPLGFYRTLKRLVSQPEEENADSSDDDTCILTMNEYRKYIKEFYKNFLTANILPLFSLIACSWLLCSSATMYNNLIGREVVPVDYIKSFIQHYETIALLIVRIVNLCYITHLGGMSPEDQSSRPSITVMWSITDGISTMTHAIVYFLFVRGMFSLFGLNVLYLNIIGPFLCDSLLNGIYGYDFKHGNMKIPFYERLRFAAIVWPYMVGYGILCTVPDYMFENRPLATIGYLLMYSLTVVCANEVKPPAYQLQPALILLTMTAYINNQLISSIVTDVEMNNEEPEEIPTVSTTIKSKHIRLRRNMQTASYN